MEIEPVGPNRRGIAVRRSCGEDAVQVAQVVKQELVELLRAVREDQRVPRRDALAAEVLVEQDRLERDVLAAGDFAQARAGNAPALLVVVAQIVAEDTADHAHERARERDELRIAVVLLGDAFRGGLAVHVHRHEQRSARRLAQRQSVLEAALPVDLARELLSRMRGHGRSRRARRLCTSGENQGRGEEQDSFHGRRRGRAADCRSPSP